MFSSSRPVTYFHLHERLDYNIRVQAYILSCRFVKALLSGGVRISGYSLATRGMRQMVGILSWSLT
jgi:hypothetical protein